MGVVGKVGDLSVVMEQLEGSRIHILTHEQLDLDHGFIACHQTSDCNVEGTLFLTGFNGNVTSVGGLINGCVEVTNVSILQSAGGNNDGCNLCTGGHIVHGDIISADIIVDHFAGQAVGCIDTLNNALTEPIGSIGGVNLTKGLVQCQFSTELLEALLLHSLGQDEDLVLIIHSLVECIAHLGCQIELAQALRRSLAGSQCLRIDSSTDNESCVNSAGIIQVFAVVIGSLGALTHHMTINDVVIDLELYILGLGIEVQYHFGGLAILRNERILPFAIDIHHLKSKDGTDKGRVGTGVFDGDDLVDLIVDVFIIPQTGTAVLANNTVCGFDDGRHHLLVLLEEDTISVRLILLDFNIADDHGVDAEGIIREPCDSAAQQHGQQQTEASDTCG